MFKHGSLMHNLYRSGAFVSLISFAIYAFRGAESFPYVNKVLMVSSFAIYVVLHFCSYITNWIHISIITEKMEVLETQKSHLLLQKKLREMGPITREDLANP